MACARIHTLTWVSANCSFLVIRAVVGLKTRDEQVQLPASFLLKNYSESGAGYRFGLSYEKEGKNNHR